jgi:hypothetical protein
MTCVFSDIQNQLYEVSVRRPDLSKHSNSFYGSIECEHLRWKLVRAGHQSSAIRRFGSTLRLFHRHALGQVAGFIHVAAARHGHVIGK